MAKKKAQPQLPAWVWLFTGVVTGLFAAFLVYLANVKGAPVQGPQRPGYGANSSYNGKANAGYNNTSSYNSTSSYNNAASYNNSAPTSAGRVNTTKPATGNAGASGGNNASSGTTPSEPLSTEDRARRFEFYTLLPEAETLGIPAEEEKPAETAKPDPSKADDTKTATATKQRTLLQTGSFQRPQDAEKLRAQILLLGLPASIQRVEVRPGETWHRVQAGPFNDPGSLANAQKTLKDARIQHIVIRMKNS